jgi:hypothetical protein
MKEQIKQLLNQIKSESFVQGYEATDEEAMGLLLSKYFEWDGQKCLEAVYSALEDSNWHTENRVIRKLIDGE